jgi:hypothetical protein
MLISKKDGIFARHNLWTTLPELAMSIGLTFQRLCHNPTFAVIGVIILAWPLAVFLAFRLAQDFPQRPSEIILM